MTPTVVDEVANIIRKGSPPHAAAALAEEIHDLYTDTIQTQQARIAELERQLRGRQNEMANLRTLLDRYHRRIQQATLALTEDPTP